ncbi:hypothetical protein [Methylotenera sp.]|uniref:phage tail assembly chaperone n=1 Tax=Methylotenera sp. TaxID=2051956 RepID=UPI002487F29D|nr:hypothetical protein [Methylotenera sp.]MDI1362510.1 hypothetical protein [Methylotenera sp.]
MLQNIAKKTGVLPQALKDKPEIGEAEYFFVSSFYELNSFRPVGENFQPLTLSDIKAYMEILGDFTLDDRLRFIKAIRTLDQAYINKRVESKPANIPVQSDMTMA